MSIGRSIPVPFLALWICIASPAVGFSGLAPSITSLTPRGSNLLIEVSAPPGLRKLTLQTRSNAGSGTWMPRAVVRLDGTGGSSKFEIPNRRDLEVIRVLADETEALPASFYEGTNSFPGIVSASGSVGLYPRAEFTSTTDGSPPGANPGGGAPRTVAESDIWKVQGDRVYFFNALRGLQVIDIQQPDAPMLRGTLALPAAGEQMYLLENEVVVLLVQAGCYLGGQKSQVILVSTKEPQPRVITSLSVEGYITESRLVGTALYVASQTYNEKVEIGATSYTPGIAVSSFDLEDPLKAVARNTLWYPGYNNVVSATDTLLFVASQSPTDWSRSVIHTIDITSPDGRMAPYVSIQPAGTLRDKFKIDYQGTRFTCVSEEVKDVRRVRLETFFLADPRSAGPVALRKTGDLKIVDREAVFATRFDGDKAYIVTFLRIDPLFVVDLSDPSRPHIVGELEVPGWSTYIHPMGDRLVSVGTESNRVAVSLFDVSNPAKPGLLSRVLLGNSYSWSESSYNEKAVTILESENLILLPFSGDTASGYASRVQLIDLGRDKLALRGVIERPMEPRRATLQTGRIYTISSRELLAVDAADRDKPVVKSTLDLSWSVDQIFLQGDHLIELSSQSLWWGNQTRTQLRVAATDAADRALATLCLTNLPIAGATLRDERLYLVQATVQNSYGWWLFPPMNQLNPIDPSSTALLTIIDLHDPLHPKLEGQTILPLPEGGLERNWQALWPKPDLLVWYAKASQTGWPYYALDVVGGAVIGDVAFPFRWWGWNSQNPSLIAVGVGEPARPLVQSRLTLGQPEWWGVGEAFTARGLVYFSHLYSDSVEQPNPGVDATGTPLPPVLSWRQRDFLDVVDYEDPKSPMLRDPVSLPGALRGITHQGELLYTLNQISDATGSGTSGGQLTALAYDGVAAHRVDSVVLDKTWLPSILVSEEALFVSLPVNDPNGSATLGALDTWRLSHAGKFERLSRFSLPSAPRELVRRGSLLTLLDNANRATLIDATLPHTPQRIGGTAPGGCFWGEASRGDGSLDKGFWIPLADYGVLEVRRGL